MAKSNKPALIGKAKQIYIDGNTLLTPLATETFDIIPAVSGCVFINGITAEPKNIIYAHDRVDLSFEQSRVFLVEHALAQCALLGIHSAEIKGKEQSWDLNRKSHIDAKNGGYLPSDVVGEKSGQICGTLGSLINIEKKPGIKTKFYEITKTFLFEDEHGSNIELNPPRYGNNLSIDISANGLSIQIDMDIINGIKDFSIIKEILDSRSLAVTMKWNRVLISRLNCIMESDYIGLIAGFPD